MKKLLMITALALTATLCAPVGFAQTCPSPTSAQVDVTPGSMDGWAFQVSGTSTAKFVNGPATPPLGKGSVEFSVGANGAGAAQIRNREYAGTKLSDLTSLSYSTYVQQDGSGGQAPYIILQVDYDNNGTLDDFLFFEPVYQDATFFPSNPQPSLVVGQWQTWDALNGGWWSVFGTAGANPGTGVKSLSDIIAAEPDATIVNSTNTSGTVFGGVRLVAGFGAGAWDNFIGNADAFTIGVNCENTVYNFEAEPTSAEQCKKGGWSTFTTPTFKNQGQCIQYVNTGK